MIVNINSEEISMFKEYAKGNTDDDMMEAGNLILEILEDSGVIQLEDYHG